MDRTLRSATSQMTGCSNKGAYTRFLLHCKSGAGLLPPATSQCLASGGVRTVASTPISYRWILTGLLNRGFTVQVILRHSNSTSKQQPGRDTGLTLANEETPMPAFLKLLLVGAMLVVGGIAAQAAGSGKVVLTISGKVAGGNAVDFSIEDLEALGLASITTSSPWDPAAVTYEGVLMTSLMQAVEAGGDNAAVLALNKYRTVVPVSDFKDHGVILATRKNGKPMPISDKGPLFVIYPFDDKPELNYEVYHARSAWQVRSIIFE